MRGDRNARGSSPQGTAGIGFRLRWGGRARARAPPRKRARPHQPMKTPAGAHARQPQGQTSEPRFETPTRKSPNPSCKSTNPSRRHDGPTWAASPALHDRASPSREGERSSCGPARARGFATCEPSVELRNNRAASFSAAGPRECGGWSAGCGMSLRSSHRGSRRPPAALYGPGLLLARRFGRELLGGTLSEQHAEHRERHLRVVFAQSLGRPSSESDLEPELAARRARLGIEPPALVSRRFRQRRVARGSSSEIPRAYRDGEPATSSTMS
jgi:hypothetical protein